MVLMKFRVLIFAPVAMVSAAAFVAVGVLGCLSSGCAPGIASAFDAAGLSTNSSIFIAVAIVFAGALAACVLTYGIVGRIALRLQALIHELRSALGGQAPTTSDVEDYDLIDVAQDQLMLLASQAREALESRDAIERLANTDALTELPNRRGLSEFLAELLGREKRASRTAILHVDLDHFKAINDSLGHAAGDFVLQQAARRMGTILRGSDMLARLGGDEFVVVVPSIENDAALERLAERIVQRMGEPIIWADHNCLIGASVGAVLISGSDKDVDPNEVLNQADLALCHAKEAGRNRWAVFEQEMADRVERARRQARDIRDALLDGEFRAWFQPMVDVQTGKITGIELLSRWDSPDRGILLPKDFLEAAESNSLLQEIGLQVLNRACQEVQSWKSLGLEVPRLHVNMTRTQLLAPGVVDKITWTLDDCNVAPEGLALEISEAGISGRGRDLMLANLSRFSDLGIETVLDDFGADTASLTGAAAVRARMIKCDRSLIEALDDPKKAAQARAVLSGTLGMAKGLSMNVVVKGVSQNSQIAVLRELGFNEMQGDLLAPAMEPVALLDWMAERSRTDAQASSG